MLASSLLSRDIFLPPHPFHFFPFSQMGLATLYLSSLSPVHFWACLEATQALLGYFFPIWLNFFPIHLSPFIAAVMTDLGSLGPQVPVFPTRLYHSLPSLTLPSRAQALHSGRYFQWSGKPGFWALSAF